MYMMDGGVVEHIKTFTAHYKITAYHSKKQIRFSKLKTSQVKVIPYNQNLK